jgi:hypothetical protein
MTYGNDAIHVVKQFQLMKQTKKVNYKTLSNLLAIHLMKASRSPVLIISRINTISEGKTEKDRIEQGKDEDIKRGLGKRYVVQVIQNGLNLLD